MRYNKIGQPVYNSQDIFEFIYQGHSNKITKLLVDIDDDLSKLENYLEIKFQKVDESISNNKEQVTWFMPDEYKNFDIENYIISMSTSENQKRIEEELFEFKTRNMLDLLRWLKFFVDHSLENDVFWGVGRGSSVSSYILFLIGIHHIDSIKYNLDWRDFLR